MRRSSSPIFFVFSFLSRLLDWELERGSLKTSVEIISPHVLIFYFIMWHYVLSSIFARLFREESEQTKRKEAYLTYSLVYLFLLIYLLGRDVSWTFWFVVRVREADRASILQFARSILVFLTMVYHSSVMRTAIAKIRSRQHEDNSQAVQKTTSKLWWTLSSAFVAQLFPTLPFLGYARTVNFRKQKGIFQFSK